MLFHCARQPTGLDAKFCCAAAGMVQFSQRTVGLGLTTSIIDLVDARPLPEEVPQLAGRYSMDARMRVSVQLTSVPA